MYNKIVLKCLALSLTHARARKQTDAIAQHFSIESIEPHGVPALNSIKQNYLLTFNTHTHARTHIICGVWLWPVALNLNLTHHEFTFIARRYIHRSRIKTKENPILKEPHTLQSALGIVHVHMGLVLRLWSNQFTWWDAKLYPSSPFKVSHLWILVACNVNLRCLFPLVTASLGIQMHKYHWWETEEPKIERERR